jgi:hypothetical protein
MLAIASHALHRYTGEKKETYHAFQTRYTQEDAI